MWKEKLHFLGNYIIKHSKVVLPAVVVVAGGGYYRIRKPEPE